MKYILLFSTLFAFFQCAADEPELNEESARLEVESSSNVEQLNMTVLLDLSDRVEPSKYPASPEHYERDIEIVSHLTEIFKSEMEDKGAFLANGKMKVIFSPRPPDPEINEIASRLSVDLAKAQNARSKKEVFDNIEETFTSNLRDIYSKSIANKEYVGSDIWRFFKNDVVDYAIEKDSSYRNILVIITDGYLYHEDSRSIEGNRSAHLTPRSLVARGLRSRNWKSAFEDRDFGYIVTRDDLDNLEILVLEINPTPDHKSDEDVIKAYLTKWFEEMGVHKYRVYNSDLPEYTKSRIDDFITG